MFDLSVADLSQERREDRFAVVGPGPNSGE